MLQFLECPPALRRLSLLTLALAATAACAVQARHLEMWRGIWLRLTAAEAEHKRLARLADDLLLQADTTRLARRLPMLETDISLEQWLEDLPRREERWKAVDAIAQAAQQRWPRYKAIRLSSARAPTIELLRGRLFEFVQQQ